jgi:DNA-binding NarL/FixJ family response regulator
MIKAVVEAGASGYILKDDQETIRELGSVVRAVAGGGVHFSQGAYRHLKSPTPDGPALTQRQLEALSLCSAYPDVTTGELARRLGVAHSTLRNLLSGVYLRLEVHSRMAAVAKANQLGLITPPNPPILLF